MISSLSLHDVTRLQLIGPSALRDARGAHLGFVTKLQITADDGSLVDIALHAATPEHLLLHASGPDAPPARED